MPSRRMVVLAGIPRNGTLSGVPQEEMANREPGLRKPRTRAAAPSPSGSKMIPQRETAASKVPAGKSSALAPDSTNSMFSMPWAAARSRPKASISAEMSVAVTDPSGAAARAAVREGSPRPQATSRTRLPGCTPASSTMRSLMRAAPESMRSDHFSHPVAAVFHWLRCPSRNSAASGACGSISASVSCGSGRS